MSTADVAAEPVMQEGLEFEPWTFAVTPEEQAEKLACCGVDPALWGGHVDPAHLAVATILHTKRAGFTINGSLHVGHGFALKAPVPLDLPLTLAGHVERVREAAKGQEVVSRFEVRLADGSVPLTMDRLSLRLDPSRAAPRSGERMGGERKPNVDDAVPNGAVELRRHRLVPEQVAAYSSEAENLIHSDPEVARKFGFRAPIAGGLMAVRLVTAVLAERGLASAFGLDVRFRRPMFWDEELTVVGVFDPQFGEGEFEVLKEDGKVAVAADLKR